MPDSTDTIPLPATDANRPLRILSLGAGVQSTALLLMSIRGVLPRLDAAVFADTGAEPPEVYDHLHWLSDAAAVAGVPLHVVSAGNLGLAFTESVAKGNRAASVPLFVLNPDGSQGLMPRQCTADYKLVPVNRKVRELCDGKPVDVWLGITVDESRRAKASTAAYRRHVFPFLGWLGDELLPRMWTRNDCLNWLAEQFPGRLFPRSACTFCPYRSNAEWRRMREEQPRAWGDAVAFDAAVRSGDHKRVRGQLYVHRQMVPLASADLRDDDDRTGQSHLFGMSRECEGMCGV